MQARTLVLSMLALALQAGCPSDPIGAEAPEASGSGTTSDESSTSGASESADETGTTGTTGTTGDTTGDDPFAGCDAVEPGGLEPEGLDVPADCPPITNCKTDADLDGVTLQCDNAPNRYLLPPLDQDYDGIGDHCDLCVFAHDPTNLTYTDDNGSSWPSDGAYCNGAYALNERDPAMGCLPGT